MAHDVDLVARVLLVTDLCSIVIVVDIMTRWTQYFASVFDHCCALLI